MPAASAGICRQQAVNSRGDLATEPLEHVLLPQLVFDSGGEFGVEDV